MGMNLLLDLIVSIGPLGRTHNFGADHRDAVVMQLVLEQQHLVEEHDLFPGLQLLHVDPFLRLGRLRMNDK